MSKVVRGLGKAISKVVKGVVNVVKKVVKSPIFKAVALAATVYFGGAALMGGFGAASSGGSFLSGMSAGFSNAVSGISGAWSSLMGGNLSGAASSLGSGLTNAYSMGAGAAEAASMGSAAAAAAAVPLPSEIAVGAAPEFSSMAAPSIAVDTAASTMTPNAFVAQNLGGSSALTSPATALSNVGAQIPAGTNQLGLLGTGAGSGAPAATGSVWEKILSSQYTAPGLIQAGGQILNASMQTKAANEAEEERKRQLAQQQTNMGSILYPTTPETWLYPRPAQTYMPR